MDTEKVNFKSCKRYFYTNKVTVTFTKKDGSVRVMNCTLDPSILPEYVETEARKKAVNDDILAVWDLDALAWRSFRWDSVTNITIRHG